MPDELQARLGPPLPSSRLRRACYRWANCDPQDIACHADRSRWTRIASALSFYFLYASVGTFAFAQGIASGSTLACLGGALIVASAVVSFDRGILGTTNANLAHIGVPEGEGSKAVRALLEAHSNPVRSMRKGLIVARVILAVLMALVITEQLNAAVFHKQISRQQQSEHAKENSAFASSSESPATRGQQEITRKKHDLDAVKSNVSRLQGTVRREENAALASSKGHDVTGLPGCGKECRHYLGNRNRAQGQLETASHQLEIQTQTTETAIAAIRSRTGTAERAAERTIENNRGGLSDTLALYKYLGSHLEGLLLFGPLTIVLLALDLAALLYKLGGKDSLYERRQALRIRLAWQSDVAATGPLNRRLASALDATVEAYGAARRGLKDWIAAGVRDPVVIERFKLIARDALLSQLDRRRHDRGAPNRRERRNANGEQSLQEEQPPLQQFPQRAGDGEEFRFIDLVPGAIVAGERRWRLVGRLPMTRQGGHSVVFEAVEEDGSERVVIKFMYLPQAQGTEIKDMVRERARRELRNVGRLPSSPFIVPIVDQVVEPSQGAIWLATPFAEYGSLASFYKGRPRRSVREVVTVAGQVAAALNVAYTELQMVHRDVKPGNVLVARIEQREGAGPAFAVPRAQVTDWGLSRIESMMESELDVTPGGTLWFAAPQAYRSGAADPRDDLFGLGCLIWWLVVGEPPLCAELGPEAGPADIALCVEHRQDSPRPWDRLGFWQPNTPPELSAFVQRLVAFDRDRRAPRGVNPLHWAETQLKGLLDLLNHEAMRTGAELFVGPSCEPEGVRAAIGQDDDEDQEGAAVWNENGSTLGDGPDETVADDSLFEDGGSTDVLERGPLTEPKDDSPAAAS